MTMTEFLKPIPVAERERLRELLVKAAPLLRVTTQDWFARCWAYYQTGQLDRARAALDHYLAGRERS